MGVHTHFYLKMSVRTTDTIFFNYAVEVLAILIEYWYVHGYEGKKTTVE